jgi:ArsR family transcriptional regulator
MRIRKDLIATEKNSRTRMEQIAKISDALAHPARIDIFKYIMKCNAERKPIRNKDLVEIFPYSQATISQHMNKLVIGGLVQTKRTGVSTYYYANIGIIGKYIDLLRDF